MKKVRLFLILLLAGLMLPAGAGAAILDELPLEKGDTGQRVVMVQQRLIDLGYLHFRATGSYGDMTEEAVAAFQRRNGISSTGVFAEDTFSKFYSRELERAAGNASIPRVVGPRGPGGTEPGELVSWQEVSAAFPVGQTATVVDYWTKNTYQVMRTGGNYHADAAFVSAEDEQAFSACFGGSATWEKRPIVLEVGGRRFAGSTFGSLNAAGEVSIYFLDSGSDIGGIEDAEHNSNIYIAAGNNA